MVDTRRLKRIQRTERSAAWVLAVGALDLGLEQFMVIPVLPAVQQAYSASLTAATWLVTGFFLAAVTAAPMSDAHSGRAARSALSASAA